MASRSPDGSRLDRDSIFSLDSRVDRDFLADFRVLDEYRAPNIRVEVRPAMRSRSRERQRSRSHERRRSRSRSDDRRRRGRHARRSRSRSRSRTSSRDLRDRLLRRRLDERDNRRSHRTRSRSRSRSPLPHSATRRVRYSERPLTPPPPPPPPPVVPKTASDDLAKWLTHGQPAATVKELKGVFSPDFEDKSFVLTVPKLDDTVERQLATAKGAKYIMQRENLFKSMQYQILDFVKPLLVLMSLASTETLTSSFQLLESSLRLWAAAQYSITKNRRANIISAVFPKYTALLKDTSKFAPSEMSFLFGPTFMSTLLKAVDDDNKLKQAVKKTNSSFPPSERRSSRLASKEQHQQGNQPQASGSGEQSGKSNYQPTYNKRYSPISRTITLNSFSTETPKVGARLLGICTSGGRYREILGS